MAKGKRLEILSETEIDEFNSPPKFTEADRQEYFHLNDYEKTFISPRDAKEKTVFYILLLGYFKHRPIKLNITLAQVAEDLKFISKQQYPDKKLRFEELSATQKSRIYEDIMVATGIEYFDSHEISIRESAKAIAAIDIDRRAIFRATLDSIQDHNSLIPKYYILQNIVSQSHSYEMNRLKNVIQGSLQPSTVEKIRSLLFEDDCPAFISTLKKPTKSFEEKDFEVEINAFSVIDPIYSDINKAVSKLQTSKINILYFSSMIDHYTISKLKVMNFDTVIVYLVCYLSSRYRLIIDRFVDYFIYTVRKIDKDATTHSKQVALKSTKGIASKISAAADILDLYNGEVDKKLLFLDHWALVIGMLSSEDISEVTEHMRSLSGDGRRYYWEYISKTASRKIRGMVRKVFMALNFVDVTDKQFLLQQIQILKIDILAHGECRTLDQRAVFSKNRQFMLDEDDQVIPIRAEFALYKAVKDSLEKSSWYVENGESHKPFEDDLIDKIYWRENKDTILGASGVESMQKDIACILNEKLLFLQTRVDEVEKAVKNKESESVVLSNSNGEKVWTVKRVTKRDETNDKFFRALPQIKVSEIIRFVSKQTKFDKSLKGVQGRKDASIDFGKMTAVLLAKAMRMGLYKMAESSRYSYDELKTFQANYFNVSNIQNAIDQINNEAYKLSIFNHYNLRENILHGSIDGQKFRSRKSTLRSRYSSKYLGQEKGLTAPTLVVNHFPIRTCLSELNTHESYFGFDLLYNNNSVIKPDVLTTDNHGTNRFNNALLELSGVEFAPRYADLGKVINSLFKVVPKDDSWTLKLKVDIKKDRIIDGWDYTQRIYMSLRQKHVSQSTMVRKLSRSSPTNKALLSLTEYDRLIKAIYVLDLMEDIDLRRFLQHVLNRGEAYHQLQRAIEQANGPDGFAGENDRMMDESLACAQLLSSILIYFNAYLLSLALDSHIERGNKAGVEHLKSISPVAWSYINMSGEFAFDGDGSEIDINALFRLLIGEAQR